ncbi:nuclear transport factor 2 family protein [Nocardiopsis xinjiangensis]|uniref:nuclear transport factor 2 family protein n=1 Tax=Nocardiopsis xinjiangensis TaxID=124285 RepID=UPI0003676549|nr:nuclear transport factor 2 family protein [Nocardiopsis xinjiangensis]
MPSDPVEVFHQGLDLLLDKDMDGFIGLFTDDAVMEFPFAPPGRPDRLEGHAAVHEYLIGYPDWLDLRRIKDSTVHQTHDPRVIIAEFSAEGVVVASGEPYQARYISVVTIRDGRIAHFRDYWSPLVFFQVTDGGGKS